MQQLEVDDPALRKEAARKVDPVLFQRGRGHRHVLRIQRKLLKLLV
jgi:hypothetical protein